MKSASEKFKLILKSDVLKTKHVPIQLCEGSSNELNSGTAMIGIDSSAEAVLTFFESLWAAHTERFDWESQETVEYTRNLENCSLSSTKA